MWLKRSSAYVVNALKSDRDDQRDEHREAQEQLECSYV
jgi:hypothetical protein